MKRRKTPEYTLYKEAMDEWQKVMELSLEALAPFKQHIGNCSTSCPSCRLRQYYFKIEALGTKIP